MAKIIKIEGYVASSDPKKIDVKEDSFWNHFIEFLETRDLKFDGIIIAEDSNKEANMIYTRKEVEEIMLKYAKWILPWTEQDIPQYQRQIKTFLDEEKGTKSKPKG